MILQRLASFASFFITAICLTSCGFIHAPDSHLPQTFLNPTVTADLPNREQAGLLVAVTYPASFTQRARAVIKNAFDKVCIASAQPRELMDFDTKAFDITLLKTSYYVHEFYRALEQKLPANSLVLLPAHVDVEGQKLVYQVRDYSVPIAARVDFLAYHSPYGNGVEAAVASFGDRVAPMMELRTSRAAAPRTIGVIAAMDRLPVVADESINAPSILTAFVLAGRNETGIQTTFTQQLPSEPGKVIGVPLVDYSIPEGNWQAHLSHEGNDRPILAEEPFRGMANVVASGLTTIDWTRATAEKRREFARLYDAALVDQESSLKDAAARWQAIDQLAKAEAKFLSTSSIGPMRLAFDGDWGNSVRSVMTEERELIARIKRMQWMAIGAILVAGAAAQNIAALPVYQVAPVVAQYESNSRQAFEAMVTTAEAQQQSVRVEIANDSIIVSAKNQDELRQKLRQEYRKKFSSKE